MGQVRETRDIWNYLADIAYETADTDIKTGNKRWMKKDDPWVRHFRVQWSVSRVASFSHLEDYFFVRFWFFQF